MKRIVSAAILMIALMTGLAMPAYAETPPSNIASNVVDKSESLDSARVTELVAQVQRETGYQLYVYFTNDFSGTSGAQWAYKAASDSHLDSSKAVLFAVAVKDRLYGSAFPSNSDVSKKGSTMEQAAIPAMKEGKWTNAVESYANQLIAIAHKTDAESAQNSGQSDAAGGVFLTVITWIIGILVGLGLIVLGFIFGPRATRSLLDYVHDEKVVRRDIKELMISVPAGISSLDDSIVKAKDKLSYAVSMYGESALDLAAKSIESAQANMQTAIKKLATASTTSYGLKGSRYRLQDLQVVDAAVRRGKKNVSDAEKAMKDLETRVSTIKFAIAQSSGTVEELRARISEYEKTVTRVSKKFDADYLTNLVFADASAKKYVEASQKNLADASLAIANNQIDQAENLVKSATSGITDAKQKLADFNAIAQDMARFTVKRDNTVRKFEKEISADTPENAHPSVKSLIPAAKAALAEASGKEFLSGNPDKELAKVLAPATEYRNAVVRLTKLKESVKETKIRVNTSIKAMKDWQKTALVANVKEYGISVTELEKVALAEVDKIMKVDVAGVAWNLKDVSAYDLDAVVTLSQKLEYLKSTIESLTASIVNKVEKAIADEKRRQEAIRAEEDRKRKEKEKERQRKRREQDEEDARRRRSSSSSSSSYYGGGSSSGSDFSSSGGSFGGGFDSSGGSF